MKPESRRRHDFLLETFQAIDGCLFAYYHGHTAVYRPMASQLRLLFDDPSRKRGNRALLLRCFDSLELPAMRPIEHVPVLELPRRSDFLGQYRVTGPDLETLEIVKMPFTVTIYQNGLQVSDLDFDADPSYQTIERWLDQVISTHSSFLTIRKTISSVANKGGGVHVDDQPDRHVRHLERLRPAELGSNVLFIVAIARFVQEFGIPYKQLRERVGYDGRIDEIEVDQNHPTITDMVDVEEALTGPPVAKHGIFKVHRRRDGADPKPGDPPVEIHVIRKQE